MKGRTATTLALWTVIILALMVFGPVGVVILLAATAGLALHEFYGLLARMGYRPQRRLGVVIGVALVAGAYIIPTYFGEAGYYAGADLLAVGVLAAAFSAMLLEDPRLFMHSFMPTICGLVLIPFTLHYLLAYIPMLDPSSQGIFIGLWIIVVTKFTDVGGLVVGKQFGRTPLAPIISPAKTVEGLIGGILAANLVGVLFVLAFQQWLPPEFAWWKALLITPFVSLAAVVSDLFESQLKRLAKVKDSGRTLPGIGGAFDLIDSMMLSAPVAFFLVRFVVF